MNDKKLRDKLSRALECVQIPGIEISVEYIKEFRTKSAKNFHPDLFTDEAEKHRQNVRLAEINAACDIILECISKGLLIVDAPKQVRQPSTQSTSPVSEPRPRNRPAWVDEEQIRFAAWCVKIEDLTEEQKQREWQRRLRNRRAFNEEEKQAASDRAEQKRTDEIFAEQMRKSQLAQAEILKARSLQLRQEAAARRRKEEDARVEREAKIAAAARAERLKQDQEAEKFRLAENIRQKLAQEARAEAEAEERAKADIDAKLQSEIYDLERTLDEHRSNPQLISFAQAEAELARIKLRPSNEARNQELEFQILLARCEQMRDRSPSKEDINSTAKIGGVLGGLFGLIGGPAVAVFCAATGASIAGGIQGYDRARWETIIRRIWLLIQTEES